MPSMHKIATENPFGHKTTIRVDVHQRVPATSRSAKSKK